MELTRVSEPVKVPDVTETELQKTDVNTEKTESDISPNYKGNHPLSKEELAKRRAEKKKSVYESKDPAVNPGHYKSKNGLEVIDCIEAFTEDLTGIEAVCVSNILKYICRYKKKNGLQDVLKSRWYIEKLIRHLQTEEKEKKS